MNKSDLKPGMIVQYRRGDLKILYDTKSKLIDLRGECFYTSFLYHFKEDLLSELHKDLDIVKVYKDYTLKEVLWERIQLTPDERTILKTISSTYKWIARDEDGDLCMYEERPIKDLMDGVWNSILGKLDGLAPFNELFQFIKWADSEPWLISDLLNKES